MAKEYKERLRSRSIRPDFLEIDSFKNIIFKMKMKLAVANKSPDRNMDDLEKALCDLKKNKSRQIRSDW